MGFLFSGRVHDTRPGSRPCVDDIVRHKRTRACGREWCRRGIGSRPIVDRPTPRPPSDARRARSVRVLIVALVVQFVLAGLLIWGAATGFSTLRHLFDSSGGHRPPPPAGIDHGRVSRR